MKRLRRPRGDEGATLLLVLVFVLSFGLIVPALLTLAQTSVNSVAVTRTVVETSTDAEAAADRAINLVRRGDFYNEPSQRCFHDPADTFGVNDSDVLTSTGLVVGGATKVRKTLTTCQAAPDSGYPTSVRVPVTTTNRPGQALLTLGRNSEKGLRQSANNTLRIQGRVFSNSTVEVENPNARLEVDNAALIARGPCTGNVFGTPKNCDDTSQDALGVDPAYALPTALPPLRTAPTCSGGNRAYALLPGRYTSASTLSNLTKNSCGALLHFTPGEYYFDFVDPTPVWDVTDGYVVGGTIPTGARAWSLAAYPGTRPKVPGACVSPVESVTNGGVTFIFGAASRMSISGGGKVELCGQYSATRPPIAVFGANIGSGTGPVTTTITTDGAAGGGAAAYANQPRIRVKDGQTADAQVIGRNAAQQAASVTVAMPALAVPAGAVLLAAKLRVAHRDLVGPSATVGSTPYAAGPLTALTSSVTAKKPPGAPNATTVTPLSQPVPMADTPASMVREDTLDYTSALKPYFDAYGFTGVDATYKAEVALGTAATAQLDSLLLDITYEVPGFRAQNVAGSCVGQFPYTNGASGPCALITADGSNPDTRLYVQGTTYAPLAALDISLNNVSEQVFKFGVVARAVKVAITGSSSFTGAVIAVPGLTTGFASTVPLAAHLQVYVCEGSGACPAPPGPVTGAYVPAAGSGWVRRLSTQVRVVDVLYPPTPGLRKMDVVSWFHSR